MNRRSLFKRLLGTVAAVTMASAVECFAITDKIVETVKKAKRVIVNPAYMTAAYEDVIIFSPKLMKATHVVRCHTEGEKPLENQVNDPRPVRYNIENGEWVHVPFYKEAEE